MQDSEPKNDPDADDHSAAVKDEPMEEEAEEEEDVFKEEEEEEVTKLPKSKTWFLGGRMAKVEIQFI